MIELVYIPSFIKITSISGKNAVCYGSEKELDEKIKAADSEYFLIIYESDYKPDSIAVKNSYATIIISFGCDFEQIDHFTFRVDGEKITRFSLECIISLVETTSSLYDRIIENLESSADATRIQDN